MNKTLLQIWEDMPAKTDKGDLHSYLPVYEEILAPYRYTAKNILEIGIFGGASLLLWEEYFSGKVHGIDCSETPHDGLADLRPLIKSGDHNIYIGDAESEDFIKKHFKGMKFEVVVEDAGHNIYQQISIYYTLKPYLSKGSIYIIEDVQDIDGTRDMLQNIDPDKSVMVWDRRNAKQRYDDVLVIITDKI